MKLSVTVQYKTEVAHYSIIQEAAGVYLASLESFEGPPSEAPPTRIMLVRGIRRWIGSFEHQEILNELGHAIESNLNLEVLNNKCQDNTMTAPSDN